MKGDDFKNQSEPLHLLSKPTTMKATEEVLTPEVWEIAPSCRDWYSSDAVIRAYLKGKKEDLEPQQKVVMEKLLYNINQAWKHTTEIFDFFKSVDAYPIAAYLRINSFDYFSVLLVIHEADFLDKRIMQVYSFISKLENEVADDLYQIEFSIYDTEKGVKEERVFADGYSHTYKIPA